MSSSANTAHKHGFRLMLEAAKHGVVQAQAEVAMLFATGRGIDPDQAKALQWSLRAAKAGSAGAANNVGFFYAQQGNYAEAVQWYRRAAEGGIAEAELNLGLLYRDGLGVRQDLAESRLHLARAAEHGFTFSDAPFPKQSAKVSVEE